MRAVRRIIVPDGQTSAYAKPRRFCGNILAQPNRILPCLIGSLERIVHHTTADVLGSTDMDGYLTGQAKAATMAAVPNRPNSTPP